MEKDENIFSYTNRKGDVYYFRKTDTGRRTDRGVEKMSSGCLDGNSARNGDRGNAQ